MTISHIKLPLRHVPPPIFYKSLYVVLKENRREIYSARVVPMAKIYAIASPPIHVKKMFFLIHVLRFPSEMPHLTDKPTLETESDDSKQTMFKLGPNMPLGPRFKDGLKKIENNIN